LIGEDYCIRLADFDSCVFEDEEIISRGTINYRAPEVTHQNIERQESADIYSLGIILFVLRFGTFPHHEDGSGVLNQIYQKLIKMPHDYWNSLENHHGKILVEGCSEDLKDLIKSMVVANPSERIKIKEIKANEWV